MKKVSEYREHARECRSIAAKMPNNEHRDQLLAMADTWDQLASERERKLRLLDSLSSTDPDVDDASEEPVSGRIAGASLPPSSAQP